MLQFVPKPVLVAAIVALVLAAPWFVSVPIGRLSYFDEWGARAPEGSINISRTRYFFPREIQTNGLPLPGGDFGLMSDPHFFGTAPDLLSVKDKQGQSVDFALQGFDVNYGFNNPKYVEHVLAVSYGGRVSEYDVSPLDFVHSIGDVYAIARIPGKLVAYVSHFYFGETDTAWNNVLIAIDWTEAGFGETADVLFEGSADWNRIYGAILQAQDPLVDRLCATRSKHSRAFKERVTGESCPAL